MMVIIWDKVFKSGQRKICGTQPLKNLKEYDLSSTNFTWITLENFVPFNGLHLNDPFTFSFI